MINKFINWKMYFFPHPFLKQCFLAISSSTNSLPIRCIMTTFLTEAVIITLYNFNPVTGELCNLRRFVCNIHFPDIHPTSGKQSFKYNNVLATKLFLAVKDVLLNLALVSSLISACTEY